MYQRNVGHYIGVRLISANQGSSVAKLAVKKVHVSYPKAKQ